MTEQRTILTLALTSSLALALEAKSLALALALKAKSLALALALALRVVALTPSLSKPNYGHDSIESEDHPPHTGKECNLAHLIYGIH